MTTAQDTTMDLQSVLYEFRLENETVTPAALDTICRAYPHFAKDLTDFAIQWVLRDLALAGAPVETPIADAAVDAIVGLAMSDLQNRLYKREKEARSPVVLSSADEAEIRSRFKNIEMSPPIDRSIAASLQRKLVELETIPRRFLERLASAIKTDMPTLVAYLSSSSIVGGMRNYRADSAPQAAARMSYQDLVERSTLSQEKKDDLLALND